MLQDSTLLRCDLHSHSLYSDGVLSPCALAAAMQASGVAVFALTDHDTVGGVREAQQSAQQYGIRCLGGIELTIRWGNGTFHLLGLGLRDLDSLEKRLTGLQQRRGERNQEIFAKLRKLGVDIDSARVLQHCGKLPEGKQGPQKSGGSEILNRSHIARYLADKGYCSSYNESFSRYLADGAAACVAIKGPLPEEGIAWIHEAGGYAFIAHPHSLQLNWRQFGEHLRLWHDAGLDGLELSHPRTSLADSRRMALMLEQHGMQYCGGSDYHRGETANILGTGTEGRPIELPAEAAFLQREYRL